MPRPKNEDAHFRVLRLLEQNPELSQREVAEALGISLGAANYVLRALVEKGQIKVKNFRASDNKLRYAYILTPSGIDAKARLTIGFLRRKYAEYEALKLEIEGLKADLENDAGPSETRQSPPIATRNRD
jgi:EPS-associated MarR family transcriptional regulator